MVIKKKPIILLSTLSIIPLTIFSCSTNVNQFSREEKSSVKKEIGDELTKVNDLIGDLDYKLITEDWELVGKDKISFENEIEKIRKAIIGVEEKFEQKRKYLKNIDELLDFLRDTKVILIKTLLDNTHKGRWNKFDEYVDKYFEFRQIAFNFW